MAEPPPGHSTLASIAAPEVVFSVFAAWREISGVRANSRVSACLHPGTRTICLYFFCPMTDELPKQRRRTGRVTEAEVGLFIKKYARRAHRGHDPNDRSYDRYIEKKIKRMKAEDVDRLLRGEEP